MTEGNCYPKNTKAIIKIKGFGAFSSMLLSGLLFFSLSSFALPLPNNAPSFVNGNAQVSAVCQNSSADAINSILAINDLDAGQTETWSVISGPLHGSLGGFNATATSTGATVTPIGLTYTPTSGYSGNDTFTVQVSDGFDTSTTTVYLIVNPLPTLTSTLTPPDICDGAVFNYVPTSASPGATFGWSRPFTGGISNPADTGSGNPFETLVSVSYDVIPVTYTFTMSANGCTVMQNVVVVVKPTPRLTSPLGATICSGATFMYTPTSLTTGTTYTWSRNAVAGISPSTAVGSGNVNETLTNSTSSPATITYMFTLAAYGCTSSKNVALVVNPETIITTITTESPASVCSGTGFQNFGAGIAPPPGVSYMWSATNANIYAVGSDNQFVLVNFPNGGNATVTLTTKINSTGCLTVDTYPVSVNSVGYTPAGVIYSDYQFVYLDNKIESYQWGYDDASTLDSTLIPGATFQSYPNNTPDFVNNYYWVITTKNGCWQKIYFNQPAASTGVKNVQAQDNVGLKIYPNPASSIVSVEVSGSNGNPVDVIVMDMLGQTIKTQSGTAHSMQFNVADMPTGCYLVSCSRDGVKIATARFIKY